MTVIGILEISTIAVDSEVISKKHKIVIGIGQYHIAPTWDSLHSCHNRHCTTGKEVKGSGYVTALIHSIVLGILPVDVHYVCGAPSVVGGVAQIQLE